MSFGQRMMAAMGHKDGEGLGKEGAGTLTSTNLDKTTQNTETCSRFSPHPQLTILFGRYDGTYRGPAAGKGPGFRLCC